MKNQNKTTRIDAEERDMNHFQTLPDEMKYRILARLDTKGICRARAVCRDWNGLLSLEALQTLALSSGVTASSTFLVRFFYFPLGRMRGMPGRVERVGSVTVDHEGNLSLGGMSKDPFFSVYALNWDVSPNGFAVLFPFQGNCIKVCHLSLRWITFVKNVPISRNLEWFRGSCYDPSTSHFTLLVGYAAQGCCNIYLYSSETMRWEGIVQKAVLNEHHEISDNAQYSQGRFFWIDRDIFSKHGTILVFDLADKTMRRLSFPDECPLHPPRNIQCFNNFSEMETWELKGCDGKLMLAHRFLDMQASIRVPFLGSDLVVWELQYSLEWRHVLTELHHPFNTCFPVHNADRSGWWLWADFDEDYDVETDMLMLDEEGNTQHSFQLSGLLSFLDIAPQTEGGGCRYYATGDQQPVGHPRVCLSPDLVCIIQEVLPFFGCLFYS